MMRIILFVIMAAFLVACPTPTTDGPPHSIDVEGDTILPGQKESKDLTLARFENHLGISLNISTNTWWSTTTCPDSDSNQTAVVYGGKCYAGLLFTCDEIYVAKRKTVAHSAYIHELGHCILLHLGMDGDAEHKNQEWWKLIREVKNEARSRGW